MGDIVDDMINEMGGEEQVVNYEQQQQQQQPQYYQSPQQYHQPPPQSPQYIEVPPQQSQYQPQVQVETADEDDFESIDLGFNQKDSTSLMETIIELVQTPLFVTLLVTLSNLQVVNQLLQQFVPQMIGQNLVYFSLFKGVLSGLVFLLLALVFKL